MSFYCIRTVLYHHILLDQQHIRKENKENTKEEEDVKGRYILLSGILAVVVISTAVRYNAI